MPIGNKFGTNAVKQIWAITYFTLVLIELSGRNILQNEVSKPSINLSKVTFGMYHLQLLNVEIIYSKKIMVTR